MTSEALVVPLAARAELPAHIAAIRSDRPERTVAVVYDCADADDAPPRWADRMRSVMACIEGGVGVHLRSDSSGGSLGELRHRVDDVVRGRIGTHPGSDAPAGPAGTETVVADTVLLVDELVCNAMEHGEGLIGVDVAVLADRVLVAVTDPRPGSVPVPDDPPPVQPSGRGLLVVDALSRCWGVVVRQTSKSVWAEVARPT